MQGCIVSPVKPLGIRACRHAHVDHLPLLRPSLVPTRTTAHPGCHLALDCGKAVELAVSAGSSAISEEKQEQSAQKQQHEHQDAVRQDPTFVVKGKALLEDEEDDSEDECSKQIGEPATFSTYQIKSFDPLPQVAKACFPADRYQVEEPDQPGSPISSDPVALMLQYHQLKPGEVGPNVCCVSRFGSGGFANVPIADMTEMGIPVFTTPAANANAVKELVVCAILLASRGVVEGHRHVNDVVYKEEEYDYERVEQRLERDRQMFMGREIEGKTLGVIGLGNIGSRVAITALALGMKVVGFDPWIGPDGVWKLPGDRMSRAERLEDLLKVSDFITIHVHYFNVATRHLLNLANLQLCKPTVNLINFSPSGIIDGEAVLELWDKGRLRGKYVSDFADPFLTGHPRHIVLPHLGAMTHEAQVNSAAMAVTTVADFIDNGTIVNSVNFPNCSLTPMEDTHASGRLCLVVTSAQEPGVLAAIDSFLGEQGILTETQVSATKGDIAYLMMDLCDVRDPRSLLLGLARKCRNIYSSRYIDRSKAPGRGTDRPRSYFCVSKLVWEHADDCIPDCEEACWGNTASLGDFDHADDCDPVNPDSSENTENADCVAESWGAGSDSDTKTPAGGKGDLN